MPVVLKNGQNLWTLVCKKCPGSASLLVKMNSAAAEMTDHGWLKSTPAFNQETFLNTVSGFVITLAMCHRLGSMSIPGLIGLMNGMTAQS